MSDAENASSDDSGSTDKHELLLPEGEYVLECWKVKEGSLVRTGETVAVACLESIKNSNATAAAAAAASSSADKHKRPSRRKITTVAHTVTSIPTSTSAPADKTGEELRSIKLFPTLEDKARAKNNVVPTSMMVDSKKPSQTTIPITAPSTGFVRQSKDDNNKRSIGYIEPCSHPAVVDGMCGVCGMPLKATSNVPIPSSASSDGHSLQGERPANMKQVTVSGGLTFTVSEEESQAIAQQDARRLKQLKKLSLVLDLDHTLVHATADARAGKHLDERDDVRSLILSMTEQPTASNHWMQHFCKFRPHVKEFFEKVIPMYEIGVYTAGTRQYAEQIATVISRHLVGAKHDQIHLDRLKYEVPRLEAQLQRQQALQKIQVWTNNEDTKEKSGNDEEKDGDTESAAKKRKVTFTEGTKAESITSDEKPAEKKRPAVNVLTAEYVSKMKAELDNAEKLEKEAFEMRQRVFGSRIVSRSDVGDLGRDVKSLKRIFPCGGTMAAVLDDREDVWANARDNNTDPEDKASTRKGEPPENLLLVKPYHWQPFVGFADVNNASGVDWSEKFDDEKSTTVNPAVETDVQLLWTADILQRLHSRYFDQEGGKIKTTPELLREMRMEVLKGFKIVLSGLVPLHKQGQEGDMERPRPSVVRYAESLGAIVSIALEYASRSSATISRTVQFALICT